jgi:transcriptional regulator EpsA
LYSTHGLLEKTALDVIDGVPLAQCTASSCELQAGRLSGGDTSDDLARWGSTDLESLMLNLELSMTVRARHQFFSWTQGSLQSLIEHALLICVLRPDGPAPLGVDTFSTIPIETARVSEIFRQDASFLPRVIRGWEQNHGRPLTCKMGEGGLYARSAIARELNRIGANHLIAHGTHDASGKWVSMFAFACHPGMIGPKLTRGVELAVPFLHAAWMRVQVNWPETSAGVKPGSTRDLTSRQCEILEWIYRGKNNSDIASILNISALTVKNHVQRILRKLKVMNRAQAVGKALALSILNS